MAEDSDEDDTVEGDDAAGETDAAGEDGAARPSAPAPSGSSAGSVTGIHPGATRRALPVAATTQASLNTLRSALLPIACWKLEDLRFDFDSSFIKPEGADEFSALLELREQHEGAPLSIFGHADPTGKDDYNKTLAGRRALAVHAVLIRDLSRWEALYSKPFGGDEWGVRSIQHMLLALGFDPSTIDGKMGPHTRDAVRAFQQSKHLDDDGDPGPKTRRALFTDYMNFLCSDAQGEPVTLTKDDFLARGADEKLRGDVQGCGEFNPVLVLSNDEDQALSAKEKQTERDATLLPDRRVMAFLFVPGVSVEPARWPCPAAEDGPDGCKAQFYSDAETRRSPGSDRRLYELTHDTMACRFYDRLARRSPCEVTRTSLMLRLLNHDGEAIPNAVYRVTLANGEVRRDQTGDDGWLIEQNVETPEKVLVEWGYPPELGISDDERAARWGYPGPFGYRLEVLLDPEKEKDAETQAKIRLANLGYNADRSLTENLIAFQRDYEVFPALGALNDETQEALREAADDGVSCKEFSAKHAND
ncbi:MAG TPA: peptidoglycan-binding protein [Polyangiaceae bacterium]|jgi:outer membrane protein OmpA-like peptidoglycan-associated protein|nr:peptidoglycan-binding protein [Polyangiaceae bacterium]